MDTKKAEMVLTYTLKLPIAGLNKFGLFPKNRSKEVLIPTTYLTILAAYLVAAAFQFTNMKREVSQYVDNLEALIGGIQLFRKVLTLTYCEEDFKKLINKMRQFWNPNECNESTVTEINSVYNIVLRVQKLSLSISISAVFFAIISPLFGKSLPSGAWAFEEHYVLYYVMLTMSELITIFSGLFCCFFDCMYAAFCAEIIVQFKILCYHIEHLAADDGNLQEKELNFSNKMKKYVDQHRFLIKFVDEFQSLYSTIMLVQYSTVCLLLCIELYAAMESYTIQFVVRYATMGGIILMQLIFYCIPANYITDEAMAVSNAAYFSKWYSDCFPSMKQPLLLMIQKSQQEITIKAGGVITMNAPTVLAVLKVAWSACSVMRQLK
ncbi:hypothetical protein ILUMI_19478 [Ignelater luminosus]|uniref:Odorant receptor n=1 Tax=Ignelater luminosus TaxID=2038154 RepID=A0A8K0FZW2_IGNLU|nr:hypothetical protein ILUMI_19478 [Ignelater luminosus]